MNPLEPEAGGDNLGEVLSQSEVERLLSQVQAEQATPAVTAAAEKAGLRPKFTAAQVQPCDFRQPAFLTASELRKIRLRHEEFIRSLAARLSLYLRLEVTVQMSKLQTITYQKFTDELTNPTHLTLFKLDPLEGVNYLEIPPRLGLTLVERLLGGQAHSVNAARDLSEIEMALLDQTVGIILSEWRALWEKKQELRPSLLGHENTGKFLQSASSDAVMLVLGMETRLGDCLEQIQLAFPYFTIEPLVRHLSEETPRDKGPAEKGPKYRWNPQLDDVTMLVSAEWGGLELSAMELASLKCGDVLSLDPSCLGRVQVNLEQVPRFHGRLGTAGKKWAVELVENIRSASPQL